MDGTTLCPHCNTRFRIAGAQLEAHQGMVRCGSCLQAFDARPGFIPDQPDPQLELPMLGEQAAPVEQPAEQAAAEPEAAPRTEIEFAPDEAVEPAPEVHHDSLDFVPSAPADQARPAKPLVIQAAAQQDAGDGEGADEEEIPAVPRKRRWPWIAGSVVLLLLLVAQAAYFFRVELGARLPGMKPALVSYCKLLNCTVPLPQNADLMSIESSELEADPTHASQITLVALLRNRATHPQAFPNLELSLNDTEDKVLARRTFKPADYLPATESADVGLKPNHELNIRLRLDTTELRPTGYRLALFYPQ